MLTRARNTTKATIRAGSSTRRLRRSPKAPSGKRPPKIVLPYKYEKIKTDLLKRKGPIIVHNDIAKEREKKKKCNKPTVRLRNTRFC
jgi:hypothetical protein